MEALNALLVFLVTGLAMLGIVKICEFFKNYSSNFKKSER